MQKFILIAWFVINFGWTNVLFSDDQASLEFEKLKNRITALEKQNKELSDSIKMSLKAQSELADRIKILENGKTNPKSLTEIIPQDEEEKKSFFKTLHRELKSDQDRASGPWTEPDSWVSIRKRMSAYQVRMALGNPTNIKQSINPGIEFVYIYEGDLNADGEIEKGMVNLRDNRVVSFQSPHSN